jgi:signal transduction histidine kinase
VVEIHPPNLQAAGLEAALSDLLAPLASRDVAVDLDVREPLAASPKAEALVYRSAVEAIRNVQRHAAARTVRVRVRENGTRLLLEVHDDGRGFSAEERALRREEGHLGLALLGEMVEHEGGSVEVRSRPGEGTTVAVEVPST